MKPTLAVSAALAAFLFAAPTWAQTTAPMTGGNADSTVSGQLPATGTGINGGANVGLGLGTGTTAAPNGTPANGGTTGTGTGGSTGGSATH